MNYGTRQIVPVQLHKLKQMSTIIERFWSKVRVTNNDEDCWEWKAGMRGNYGVIRYQKRIIDSHRLSYILKYGEINDSNVFVCHKCDNPLCVNPKHLFLGTHSDNMKDAYKKGRLPLMNMESYKFKKGNIPVNKKYSTELIEKVLKDIENNPHKTIKSICELYNVRRQVISDIRKKKKIG